MTEEKKERTVDSLSKKERAWLDGDVLSIGGWSTEVSMVGFCLCTKVKDAFPMNQVPSDVALGANKLLRKLEEAEAAINSFIVKVSEKYVEFHGEENIRV